MTIGIATTFGKTVDKHHASQLDTITRLGPARHPHLHFIMHRDNADNGKDKRTNTTKTQSGKRFQITNYEIGRIPAGNNNIDLIECQKTQQDYHYDAADNSTVPR